MSRAEMLKSKKPELIVDLTLYPSERGGPSFPKMLGWSSPCTIQHERGDGWVGYDGWPLLGDEPISPGETRRVGYVFLSGQEVVNYQKAADRFYIWEGRIIGEAKIVEIDVPINDAGSWREAAIGFSIDEIRLGGLNVWNEEWRKVDVSPVTLPHPAYPKQMHDYEIWEIGPRDKPVRFAAAELSNSVWGFYLPAKNQADK